MQKQRKVLEKSKPRRKREREFGELPERFELWKAWNLLTWGGVLPGHKAVLAADAHRRTMATAVSDIPWPAGDRLDKGKLYKSGCCWYANHVSPVQPTKNPQPNGSFAFASQTVKVKLPEQLLEHAELVIPLETKATQHLIRSTIRLFRWDEDAKAFHLVPMSAADKEGKLAWGRIRESGLYVAVGYPRDPIVRHAVKMLQMIGPYRRAAVALGIDKWLKKRFCPVILCPGDLWGIPVEEIADDWMVIPEDFGSVQPRRGRDGRARPFKPTAERIAYLTNICSLCDGMPDDLNLPEAVLEPDPDRITGAFTDSPSRSQWVSIGPANITCVIRALAAHPTDPNILYAGAEYGGVWKTTDGGTTWTSTMDTELNLHVDALGLCRTHPDVLYAGMSNGNRGGDMDVYRSDDAAASWVLKTSLPSLYSRAIAVHSVNPNVVYVAGDQSLHKSEDGGRTWPRRNVVVDGVVQENVSGIFDGDVDDVKIDQHHPSTVYIAVRGRGIYKSVNGGNRWRRIATDARFVVRAFRNDIGDYEASASADGSFRTLLAIGEDLRPGKNGSQFIVAKIQGTILVSQNGGDDWRVLPGSDHGYYSQNYWDSCVAVCPADQDYIVVGGYEIGFTLNANDDDPTWSALRDSLHPDQQAVAFTPSTSDGFYFANDGFIGKAERRGAAVRRVSDGLVASQCFNVAVSQALPLVVGCSTYHTGTIRTGRTHFSTWEWINGPEGGLFEIDPTDEKVMFESPWGGSLHRTMSGGGHWEPLAGMIDVGSTTDNPREAYVVALGIRPDDSRKLYASAFFSRLHYSTDRGDSWNFVKYADGTPFLIDGPDVRENHAMIFAYSPSNGDYLYIGTRHGHLWRTRTAATSAEGWEELNTPYESVSSGERPIRAIAVHPTNPNKIYIGYQMSDVRAVWGGIRQAGGTFQWRDISGLYRSTALPRFPVNALIVDPRYSRRIFAATNIGVFVTDDEGDWWRAFNEGLPNVSILDLRLRRRTRVLYAAAYGRGIFMRAI